MRDAPDPDEEDFRNDPLVRIAATIMDPLHGKLVPPSPLTPLQLIELAARQRRDTVRRRLKWLGAPLAVAALVVVVLVTAADFFAGQRPAPIAASPADSPAPSPAAPPAPLPLP
ncbi:MAG TPA: hypothetical protein VJT31_37695, partial [Rugosimonospora sp.]|nr:hypothetical protein [Rugosimonospora sp.]